MKKIYRWKFLREGFRSQNGVLKWEIGKWNRVEGKLLMCENGLHCSKSVFDAFNYVQGEILARVECRGDRIIKTDKECWREMKVVKAYEWTKKDTVEIAIYAARLVLPIFEKLYPEDKRPRKAIKAAIKWLKNPTFKNRLFAKMEAKNAEFATWKPLGNILIEKIEEEIDNGGAANAAARAAVFAAIVAGSKDLIWSSHNLCRQLASVRLASKTAIKKIQARFNKQVKMLKEIKNEEGWLTKTLKKVKMIRN